MNMKEEEEEEEEEEENQVYLNESQAVETIANSNHLRNPLNPLETNAARRERGRTEDSATCLWSDRMSSYVKSKAVLKLKWTLKGKRLD